MEILLVMMAPLALLWVGYSLATSRSLEPAAVMRSMLSIQWRILRWLWKERPQRSGAGRLRQPLVRYRD